MTYDRMMHRILKKIHYIAKIEYFKTFFRSDIFYVNAYLFEI